MSSEKMPEEMQLALKNCVNAVIISKEIDDGMSIFVLLARDGSINRIGNGSLECDEKDMFIGITQDKLFEKFMDGCPAHFITAPGEAYAPQGEMKGKKVKVTLMFNCGEEERGLMFFYGTDSGGIPEDLSQVVDLAIDVTEPWYQNQRKMTGAGKR